MKNIYSHRKQSIFVMVLLALTIQVVAQVPVNFNYQLAIRDTQSLVK